MSKVLIVDDNPDIRLVLEVVLEDAGHEVIEADDGDQVLAAVLEHRPDALVMDVMMVRVNGFEALKILKADERVSKVPVIMATGQGLPEGEELSRSLGAVAYIRKPWGIGEIEALIDDVLSNATG